MAQKKFLRLMEYVEQFVRAIPKDLRLKSYSYSMSMVFYFSHSSSRVLYSRNICSVFL